ncbi:MAG TPA: hypothetical protein VGF79_12920 [Bacteroidia bacterium]
MRVKENTLPISALVASCNEGFLLEDCLKSLQFCDEIYFVDLNSDDNSIAIAEKWTDVQVTYKRVNLIEEIHPVFVPELKNDWFLLIDPDERITKELADSIRETLSTVNNDISVIRVPMFNYFKGRQLKGTVFGGLTFARCLYKRSGVNVNSEVHSNIQKKEGFDRIKIKFEGKNFNMHLWCQGWSHLIGKHNRYLKGEGKAQYLLGNRYSFLKQMKDTVVKFYYSFKTRQGYKDGMRGFALSLIAARYEFLKWNELRKYQHSLR